MRARDVLRPPVVHWPSVVGRARADAGPLLLVAAVVVVVTLLAGAVPPLLDATAGAAVRDAVRRAGDGAAVQVFARWERDDGPTGGRVRNPRLAEDVDDFRDRAVGALDPGLRATLHPPVATVTSAVLKITDGSVLRTFQLTYVAGAGGGPPVTWVAGGPPRPAVAEADRAVEVPYSGPPWPVQVGLSEADAAALNLRPGDRIPLVDEQKRVKQVEVSGVFRAADERDPAWRLAPWLLHPVAGADGVGTTRLAGLLSRESLPDARLAFDQDQLDRAVWFTPDPDALTWQSAQTLAATVVALKAASGSSGLLDTTLRWQTRLDAVLADVRTQVDAASAQASVLLTGVVAATVLVLLLAADLLVRRRAPALAAGRQRGTALPDLGAELLVESAAVALSAAAAGLVLARLVAPGVAWRWAVPVFLAAVAAGPAFGLLTAARATRNRPVPANRSARRWASRTGQLRRAALEAAVVVAAAGAFVALHQRGILPTGDVALPASAPALGGLTGALALLRLLPAGTRLALGRALRSRRPLAVFGAARAAATSARVLPLVVLVTCAALASYAVVLAATAERGLADGAWRSVGADARLDVAPAAVDSTPELARRIAAAPDVRQAVAGQVTDGARVAADAAIATPRLVIVDAAAFQRLLAATPLPAAPDLTRLTTGRPGGVPALVRSRDGSLRPGLRLRLLRDAAPAIDLTAVGTAPAVGDAGDIVFVDAASIAAAGLPVVPNTVWAAGPGAERAVAANAVGGEVFVRTEVQRARRTAPLTSGLLRLAWGSAVALLALGLLGLALGAAAGAPERWETLTRLRTLGLRPRDARWVATGELLPPVALAAFGGPVLGVALARLTLAPLALSHLTHQPTEPTPTVPWWLLCAVTLTLLAAVPAVVPAESAFRRRHRLADVLRAGSR